MAPQLVARPNPAVVAEAGPTPALDPPTAAPGAVDNEAAAAAPAGEAAVAPTAKVDDTAAAAAVSDGAGDAAGAGVAKTDASSVAAQAGGALPLPEVEAGSPSGEAERKVDDEAEFI